MVYHIEGGTCEPRDCKIRVLRKLSGPKRVEVVGKWRRKSGSLGSAFVKYLSGDQINKNELGGACGMYGRERRGTYRVLVGKP